MKKLILFLFFASLSIGIQAKSGLIKETKGREFAVQKSQRVFDFTNAIKIGDDYYVIGKKFDLQMISILITYIPIVKASDFLIFKLDKKMNVKAVSVIPAEFNNKDVQSYTLKRFGDRLCALFYFNNRKTHKQYLFAQMMDVQTMEADGDPYKIGETMITKHESRIRCLFRVDVSADFSKMLITADRSNAPMSRRAKKAAKSQKSHVFSYALIDHQFRQLNASKNVKIGKGGTEVIGQTFDNEGNMCFLAFEGNRAKVVKKKKRKFEDDIDEQEEVDKNQSRLIMKIIRTDGTESDLSFAKGEFFYSATLKLHPKTGNVAVVGLLASGKYGAKGIFTQQVNLGTGEVLTESIQPFGKDLLNEISNLKPLASSKKNKRSSEKKEKEKSEKEKKKELKDLEKQKKKAAAGPRDYIPKLVRLGAIHYNENNELVIVTQKYHTYTVTTVYVDAKGNRHTQTTRYYVYGDIISFKLNSEGGIDNFGYVFHSTEWLADIDKDFSSLYSGQKLFLITKLEACQMQLDNTVSKTEPFKELETYKTRRSYADFINVSDNELLHILSRKKNVTFTLLSVNVDND